MRECLICGKKRWDSNGDKYIKFDYCESCLKNDVETLRKIQLRRERKASSVTGKATKEANE